MTFTITKGAVTITMPVDPVKIVVKHSKAAKVQPLFDQAIPWVFEVGGKPRVLTIAGKLAEAGKTAQDLYTDYLSTLKDWAESRGVVTLDLGGTRYDGDYYFISLTYEEKILNYYEYTMEFWKA